MKRIALYIRVSTEEQAKIQEGSLKSQEQRLREYVDRRNEGESWGQIVAVFVEEGRSGKDTNRPELQKMLSGIKQRLFDLVMVTELSRLSRSTRDFCNMLDLFKGHTCKILSLREQFDTTTASGEMMMHMLMNFAQFERQQTGERISANFRARAKRGLYNGGSAPLGYTYDKEHKGRLKVLPDEAKTVQECYYAFLQEGSLARAAKSLNQMGFSPKRFRIGGGKYRVGLAHFTVHTLHRILTNPVNIAKRKIEENGKIEFVPAQWEPVISENIFWAVKKKLLENKDRYKPESYKRHPYLLTSLLYCSLCNQPLTGKSSYGRNGKHFYYAHSSQMRRNHTTQNPGCHCPIGSVRAISLENATIQRLKGLVEEPQIATSFLEKAKENHKSHTLKDKIKEQEKLLDDNNHKISTLLSHLESVPVGKKALSLYDRLLELEEKKKKLKEELEKLHTEFMTQIEVIEPDIYLDFLRRLVSNLTHTSTDTQKRLLKSVIQKMVVFKDKVEAYYYADKETVLQNMEVAFQPPPEKNLENGAPTLTSTGGAGTRTPDTADMNRLL